MKERVRESWEEVRRVGVDGALSGAGERYGEEREGIAQSVIICTGETILT